MYMQKKGVYANKKNMCNNRPNRNEQGRCTSAQYVCMKLQNQRASTATQSHKWFERKSINKRNAHGNKILGPSM